MEYYSIDRRKLRGWLYRNATPVKVEYDEVFSYIVDDQIVTIAMELPLHLEEYISFCKRNGLMYEIEPFILCLLHEVGHDQTLLTINGWEYTIDKIIDKITGTSSLTNLGRKLKYWLYFSSPVEKAATIWAIDLINENIDKIRELESYVKIATK